MLNENMPSSITKVLIVGLLAMVVGSSVLNIYNGRVHAPWLFAVALFGFALFLVAKLSLVSKGKLVSFGSKNMSPWAANTYRAGYWFMVVGILGTFFGPGI